MPKAHWPSCKHPNNTNNTLVESVYQILTGNIFDRRSITVSNVHSYEESWHVLTITKEEGRIDRNFTKDNPPFHHEEKRKKKKNFRRNDIYINPSTNSSYLNAAWTQRSRWYWWTTVSCGSPGTASSLTIPCTRWIVPEDLVTVRPFSVFFQHCTRTRDGNRSPSPSPIVRPPGHDDGNAAATTTMGDDRHVDGDPGRATFGDGQQVSERHIIFHVPRGLIENLYGAERQPLLRHRYTPAGEPGGGAGVLLLVPLLLPLMLPCWWWWWWSSREREMVGKRGSVGGLVGEGERGGREQNSEERRRWPRERHEATETGRVGVVVSSARAQLSESMIAAKFSVFLSRCASLTARVPRVACVQALTKLGGKYATLRATRSRRLFRQELCGFLLPVDCFPSLLFSPLPLPALSFDLCILSIGVRSGWRSIEKDGWRRLVQFNR